MRRYRQAESVESPDMTPMLDIVFIMLIFFIVSTSFVKESAVDWLSLTQSKDDLKPPKTLPLVVSIHQNGDMFLQNQLIQPEALRARGQAERAKGDFENAIVQTESKVSTVVLVKAVDDIKLAGIEKVSVGKVR